MLFPLRDINITDVDVSCLLSVIMNCPDSVEDNSAKRPLTNMSVPKNDTKLGKSF